MPASVTAVVVWDTENDCATVADITVPKSSDGTSITWNCDPTVASFTISGLDPSEFTPYQSDPDVTTFTTLDSDQQAGNYSYTVEGTHALTGKRTRHDPKIINTP